MMTINKLDVISYATQFPTTNFLMAKQGKSKTSWAKGGTSRGLLHKRKSKKTTFNSQSG